MKKIQAELMTILTQHLSEHKALDFMLAECCRWFLCAFEEVAASTLISHSIRTAPNF